MASNRDEDRMIGIVESRIRAKQNHEEKVRLRDRDQSSERRDADGSVTGRHVEYRTVTLEDGSSRRVKSVITYYRDAEADASIRAARRVYGIS
jgi:septum formation inhibitor-activating ATPase MinD